ncbi:MAG: redox-sensing transcriptional repressor Rex [Clostridia bacterium]|nr:redox-sensing transcriptional repressor Rex [Clostridia bacterium]
MTKKDVPGVVINRLPRYYRYLGDLLDQGVLRISSANLSKRMSITASQIRQDLRFFGGFGQQGYGYNVEHLYNEIGEILGLNDGDTTIIIGAGNLGHALAAHSGFEKRGFKLVGIFDNNKNIIGTTIQNIEVMSIEYLKDFLLKKRVDIAILALPKKAVQEVAQLAADCGVKGFLNFSYGELQLPQGVAVENVHISDPLMTLSYKIKRDNN